MHLAWICRPLAFLAPQDALEVMWESDSVMVSRPYWCDSGQMCLLERAFKLKWWEGPHKINWKVFVLKAQFRFITGESGAWCWWKSKYCFTQILYLVIEIGDKSSNLNFQESTYLNFVDKKYLQSWWLCMNFWKKICSFSYTMYITVLYWDILPLNHTSQKRKKLRILFFFCVWKICGKSA